MLYRSCYLTIIVSKVVIFLVKILTIEIRVSHLLLNQISAIAQFHSDIVEYIN